MTRTGWKQSPGRTWTACGGSASARDHGLISHRFYGNDDGVFVVDHWADAESYRAFFAASPDIGELMSKAGATSEPQISFYRPLAVDDVVEPAATIT
ncbi:MAG TPA: hypothetical protein VHC18_11350 [Amycolatopsis sp.]|nr:hypothetical protein [Amycolatopsis sp.]